MSGEGGASGEPTADEEGYAELYGEVDMANVGTEVEAGGGDRGTGPMGGDSGDETGPWLGVLGRDAECFIAERRGGGRAMWWGRSGEAMSDIVTGLGAEDEDEEGGETGSTGCNKVGASYTDRVRGLHAPETVIMVGCAVL